MVKASTAAKDSTVLAGTRWSARVQKCTRSPSSTAEAQTTAQVIERLWDFVHDCTKYFNEQEKI